MSFVVLEHVTCRKSFMTIFLLHSPPEDKALKLVVCEKSYLRNPEVMSSIDNDIENANKRRLRRQQAPDKRKAFSIWFTRASKLSGLRTFSHNFDFPKERKNVYSRDWKCVFLNCCWNSIDASFFLPRYNKAQCVHWSRQKWSNIRSDSPFWLMVIGLLFTQFSSTFVRAFPPYRISCSQTFKITLV